jgi:hypothetical protein
MVVSTTVKGYFHITAESLDVAQTFINIVNELHPKQYEWSTKIGPKITLWSPQPDDKMCYGIPFEATGRNDYRNNLIDMFDVIGRRHKQKDMGPKIQQLTDKELTVVVTWKEFTTEDSFIARGQTLIQKSKGTALYSAILDTMYYDRRDLTVDLLDQWGFSSWKYADYTRTGITNFMTRFKNNEAIIGELSQYDIDDLVYFAKPHGRGYLYYLENFNEADAIEFRDKLLDIMREHPTTSIVEGAVDITASSESEVRTLVSIFATSDDDTTSRTNSYRMKFDRHDIHIGEIEPQMFTTSVKFQGAAVHGYRYTIDDVVKYATHRLSRLPADTRESILNGPSFWLSFRWKERDSNRELLTNGWIMWEKQPDQTSVQTTYVEINGSISQ